MNDGCFQTAKWRWALTFRKKMALAQEPELIIARPSFQCTRLRDPLRASGK